MSDADMARQSARMQSAPFLSQPSPMAWISLPSFVVPRPRPSHNSSVRLILLTQGRQRERKGRLRRAREADETLGMRPPVATRLLSQHGNDSRRKKLNLGSTSMAGNMLFTTRVRVWRPNVPEPSAFRPATSCAHTSMAAHHYLLSTPHERTSSAPQATPGRKCGLVLLQQVWIHNGLSPVHGLGENGALSMHRSAPRQERTMMRTVRKYETSCATVMAPGLELVAIQACRCSQSETTMLWCRVETPSRPSIRHGCRPAMQVFTPPTEVLQVPSSISSRRSKPVEAPPGREARPLGGPKSPPAGFLIINFLGQAHLQRKNRIRIHRDLRPCCGIRVHGRHASMTGRNGR